MSTRTRFTEGVALPRRAAVRAAVESPVTRPVAPLVTGGVEEPGTGLAAAGSKGSLMVLRVDLAPELKRNRKKTNPGYNLAD